MPRTITIAAYCGAGLLGVCLALPVFAAAPPSQSSSEQLNAFPVDRLLVTFKPQAAASASRSLKDKSLPSALQRLRASKGANGQIFRSVANGAHVVQLDAALSGDAAQAVIQSLRNDPDVAFVEPDLRMFPAWIPSDPLYGNQWSLRELAGGIHAESAWDISLGQGAVIAVLDTGVLPHVDLVDNLLPGYDFVTDLFIANDGDGRDTDPSDPGDGVAAGGCGGGYPPRAEVSSWHGTHVAGIAAAGASNGGGISGVAPTAGILPLRVMGRCGGYTSDIVDAMYWAVGLPVSGLPVNPFPARVLNLSLGSSQPEVCLQAYADAIAAARAQGAVVVIAAGNRNDNADLYPPGNCAAALTVAATHRMGGRANYSNAGSLVDLAAPGGQMAYIGDANGILSTANEGTQSPTSDYYLHLSGTSMAAPHVAGVAALLMACSPQSTVDEIESTLTSTARPFPGSCNGCGTGIVHAARAVGVLSGQLNPGLPSDVSLLLKGTNGKFIKDAEDPSIGTISYVAEITNQGPEPASGVTLTNILPATVTPAVITPSQGECSVDGRQCDLGELAVGAKATVAIRVRTPNGQKMDFQGQVSGNLYDPDLADNFVIKRMGGAWGLMLPVLLALLLRKRRNECL